MTTLGKNEWLWISTPSGEIGIQVDHEGHVIVWAPAGAALLSNKDACEPMAQEALT